MQITKRIYIAQDQANQSFYLYVDTEQVARYNTLAKALEAARVWKILIVD